MSGSGKPSIPSWQQQVPASADARQETDATTSTPDSETQDRATLVEHASQFLQDESIRDAPTDRKIAFLESKGLRNDEIQQLLGISRNPEASSPETSKTESSVSETTSDTSQDQKISPPSSQISVSSPSTSSQPQRPDIPPVITYPEFLYQSQKPPPLLTFQSVVYTLYAASGIAASIYGASELLVKPMVASLTEARHDLAQTAERNLTILNEKLEKNVSSIPSSRRSLEIRRDKSAVDNDYDSVTSDPTELFHRDIATQTTPDLETPASSSTNPIDASVELSKAEKAVNTHVDRIHNIRTRLSEAREAESQLDTTYTGTRDGLSELHSLLDALTYSASGYSNSSFYGLYNNDKTSGDGKPGAITSGEEEAINALKKEIRSVKGNLLSAKNFPSGGPKRFGS